MSQNSSNGISRRKIVMNQSQIALSSMVDDTDSDVWNNSDTLFSDHLKEVLDKWLDIDDEIWGKIICMEKNRRVAKAYCRVPVLTIDGSENGFDGYRIGLNGFDNTKRQKESADIKKAIGEGIKVKMDQDGNIYLKKVTDVPVYIKGTGTMLTAKNSSVSTELLKNQGQLELNKPSKVFDMKRFTQNITQEKKNPQINREKLELQCIVNICFGSTQESHLECPCWVMLINIVAMDMLRNQLPEEMYAAPRPAHQRMPASMENVSAARYVSTPRDEHYPRLVRGQRTNSAMDLTLGQVEDYGTVGYAKSRAAIKATTTLPVNYAFPVNGYQLPLEYAAQLRQPLQNFQGLQQKHFQDPRWGSYGNLLAVPGQGLRVSGDWQ